MGWCNHASAELHLGDFNGDGRADMLCHDTSTGYKWVALGAYCGFTGTTWYVLGVKRNPKFEKSQVRVSMQKSLKEKEIPSLMT